MSVMSFKRSLWRVHGVVAALAVCGLLVGGPAQAAPMNGLYLSNDQPGGQMFEGHWTESYVGGGARMPGNVMNIQSWDPVADVLMDQWKIGGMVSLGNTSGGYGFNAYDTTNATMWLDDSGPWWDAADGTGAYEVAVTAFSHDTSPPDGLGLIIGQVHLTGVFAAFPTSTVDVLIAFTAQQDTDTGAHPGATYPEYLPAGFNTGEWGRIQTVQMTITPEPGTVGLLAIGGLVTLIRRRRRG